MIIFDSTIAIVKPADRPFGFGLLRSVPVYSAPYSQTDLDWLAEQTAARELDRRVDELFEEAEATRRLEAGIIFA